MSARYICCDALRRTAVLTSGLNGIDFLEVLDQEAPIEADRQRFLMVHFLKGLSSLALAPDNVRIEGGERVQDIEVVSTTAGTGRMPSMGSGMRPGMGMGPGSNPGSGY